jgi:hypothetical protein
MSLAFNNEPEVKVDPRYILYFSGKKNAYVKKQHEHFKGNYFNVFLCSTVLHKYTKYLGFMTTIYPAIYMCEAKYIGIFLLASFIKPMKDIILECQILYHSTHGS